MTSKLACPLACLLLALPVSAQGQTPSEPQATQQSSDDVRRAEAKARYEQGVEAYKAGRYKDAVDLFLEADKLAPSAPLSFNIARGYANIGDDANALRWYRDYLRRAPQAGNAAEVQEIVSSLQAALMKKGMQQLTVLSKPAGATVSIDDQPLGVTPWTGELAPGQHRVAVSMKGFAETALTVELPAERAIDASVRLVPAGEAAPAAPTGAGPGSTPGAAPERPEDRQASGGSGFGVWPWVSIGVGAAALGGALAFEMSRRSAESDAEDDTTQVGYQDKYDTMQSRQTAARVLGIVGGTFLVAGGVLLVLDLTSSEDSPAKSVSAGCALDGCGVFAKGRF